MNHSPVDCPLTTEMLEALNSSAVSKSERSEHRFSAIAIDMSSPFHIHTSACIDHYQLQLYRPFHSTHAQNERAPTICACTYNHRSYRLRKRSLYDLWYNIVMSTGIIINQKAVYDIVDRSIMSIAVVVIVRYHDIVKLSSHCVVDFVYCY